MLWPTRGALQVGSVVVPEYLGHYANQMQRYLAVHRDLFPRQVRCGSSVRACLGRRFELHPRCTIRHQTHSYMYIYLARVLLGRFSWRMGFAPAARTVSKHMY